MKLVVGNKTYSTWSLRPWLVMKHFEIPFEEILVPLDQPETHAQILKYSPSGRVPALLVEGHVIWDSLAIIEFLNDRFPERQMYPRDLMQRARARSMANEMHSGFQTLRNLMSFHAKKRFPGFDAGPAAADIARVKELWTESLQLSKGPFLFGDFGIVDAMYAPVVGRFQTYDVSLAGPLKEYSERILNLPAMQEWYAGARAEDFVAPRYEKN